MATAAITTSIPLDDLDMALSSHPDGRCDDSPASARNNCICGPSAWFCALVKTPAQAACQAENLEEYEMREIHFKASFTLWKSYPGALPPISFIFVSGGTPSGIWNF